MKHMVSMWLILLFMGGMAMGAEFTVPMADQVPVIDGRIQESEWSGALLLSGAGNPLDARRSQVWVAWDESNLYIAVRSVTPPRGKLVVQPKGSLIVMDDSVEFWFDPPKAGRVIEQAKFGEFQLIANSVGALFVQHHNPGYGLPAREWMLKGMKHANSIHDDLWDFELAIPATAFGYRTLDEMDWKMLLVRNYNTFPQYQAPFVPVASFMDSASYGTYRLRRQVPSVQQGYGDAKALQPLRFTAKGGDGLSYEATVDGKAVKGSLPVTLDVEKLPASVSMKVKDAKGGLLFDRSFALKAAPERLWHTPESYLFQDQDFEGGIQHFLSGGERAKPQLHGELKLVEGRVKGSKALHFATEKEFVDYRGCQLPVPGNISLWVKTDGKLKEDHYRRFFATDFRGSGYLGIQEMHWGTNLLFLHYFAKDDKNVYLTRHPVPGEWCHLSLNLYPKRVEYYFNGTKNGELDLPFVLDSRKLGHLVLGGGDGGFALDEYAVYARALDPDEIKAKAQGDAKLTGKLAWYPSLNAIIMDVTGNVTRLKTDCLTLNIHNKAGKKLLTRDIPLNKGFHRIMDGTQMAILHEKIDLGMTLPEGDYVVNVLPKGSDEILLEQPFKVKHYAWLNTPLGKRDCLLPGFMPVSVKGKTLSCVLRDYELAENGLPTQIVSKGTPLLARPVTVRSVKAGKDTAMICTGKLAIRRLSDTAISYGAGDSRSPLRVSGRFEQDGLLRLDLTFTETPSADRVYVDIPIRKEIATLYHAVGENVRANPGGFLPAGEGVIFKSRIIPQIAISNFIPYLWVGGDELGVAYAADWDKGWVHAEERDAVELFRHGDGTVSIRLNILNGTLKPQKDRTITIALQASPVKPMPKGWRGWSDGFGYRGTKNARAMLAPPYWGSFNCWAARYPAFQNFDYVRKLKETARTGKIDYAYVNAWIDRIMTANKEEVPWIGDMTDKKQTRQYVKNHAYAGFYTAQSLYGKPNGVLYHYTCDSDWAGTLSEYPVMCGEWGHGALTVGGSYQDYAIYYLDKMLEAGMDGVYDDNTFFRVSHCWATGDGWIDEEGTVHPSMGIWRNREYRRRQNVVMLDRGKEPWITVHHTNGNILPTIGFGTNSMGMEWKYGSHDFQERFTPDYIRAVCQGLQGGLFPTVLDGITGNMTPEKRTWVTRTMLASLLPHEVRPTAQRESDAGLIVTTYNRLFDFGIWQDDCVYTAYWNSANPVRSVTDDKLLVSTYRRGRKLLLVCGSYTGDLEARLAVKGQVASARNLETGATLTVKGNTIVFPMKKHDFALIEVILK